MENLDNSLDPKRIFLEYPEGQLQGVLFESHIGSYCEVKYVSNMIISHLRNTKDIIPTVTEHYGLGLASRCFVSLGFFKGYLNHLTKNHGYPNPEFYFRVGQTEFVKAGKVELAEHFQPWLGFLQERFKPKDCDKDKLIPGIIYETIKEHKTYPDRRQWKAPGYLVRGYELGDLKKKDELN